MSALNESRAVDELKRKQLLEDGFCRFENVLDKSLLSDLWQFTGALLERQTPEQREKYKYQGSNIMMDLREMTFARLVSAPSALGCLRSLGLGDPRYTGGFLLSKPAHGAPLYWHQDWWAWDEPVSAQEQPIQLFLMYYLNDTRRENGCLRVLPGSHRRRFAFHSELPEAHTEVSYSATPDSPLFATHRDEVDVPVNAGDLLIGDARVLHAAHANQTDERRTLLTLWYIGDWNNTPATIKAAIVKSRAASLSDLPAEVAPLIEPLIPRYDGTSAPAVWQRTPGEYLRP